MAIELYQGDIPDSLDLGDVVAVDAEMMGLKPIRDRLCLIQLSSGDGNAHIVQFEKDSFDAPNLGKLLASPDITKIFHYARSDVATLWVYLNVLTKGIYCTKTASKLVRTYTPYHGLKACLKDLLGIEISKQQQGSDWGSRELTQEQLEYAASDVFYLHQLKDKLDDMLAREGRADLALSCFDFIGTRAILDVAGWADEDIFEH